MVFNGHYQRAIDADQRIELPAAIREVNDSDQYTITRGLEGGLFLYPRDRWRELEEEMAQLDPACDDVRHFYRMIMLWAFNTETDDTGKIQIPTGLMRFAGLTQDALILGAFDHVELWDPGRFDAYLDRAAPDYEALAGRLLGY